MLQLKQFTDHGKFRYDTNAKNKHWLKWKDCIDSIQILVWAEKKKQNDLCYWFNWKLSKYILTCTTVSSYDISNSISDYFHWNTSVVTVLLTCIFVLAVCRPVDYKNDNANIVDVNFLSYWLQLGYILFHFVCHMTITKKANKFWLEHLRKHIWQMCMTHIIDKNIIPS